MKGPVPLIWSNSLSPRTFSSNWPQSSAPTFERLRTECRIFVGYWTIGRGAGKRRRHWMAKLRQWLLEKVHTGTLPKLATTGTDETGGYGKAADWS